jgi:hypothetical protein
MYFDGSHDGFEEAALAQHRRSVFSPQGNYWIVCDRIPGGKDFHALSRFQLAPGSIVTSDINARTLTATMGDATFTLVCLAGAGEWTVGSSSISPCFGKLAKADVVIWNFDSDSPKFAVFLLVPSGNDLTIEFGANGEARILGQTWTDTVNAYAVVGAKSKSLNWKWSRESFATDQRFEFEAEDENDTALVGGVSIPRFDVRGVSQ